MVPADSDRIPRVPPYSGSALVSHPLPVREYHPLCPDFPDGSSSCVTLCARPYNPDDAVTPSVWALPLSIATTQGIDFLSFPGGTEMFQFPPFAPSNDGDRPSACRVAPFGYVRIKSRLQIPAPFRSLPRPSSPPEA